MVLQIQSDSYIAVPAGYIRFTQNLLDRTNSVQDDMTTLTIPVDGLYEIKISGGKFWNGFDMYLNINGIAEKWYHAGGSGLDLVNFDTSSVMRLKRHDFISLVNHQPGKLYVDPKHEFTLTLKCLALA